ncbi:Ubiquitin-fold modifier-conjugating enzyme [Thalictrum thalictroides]|uniref:Ubiquitin-fold modifier-conjugating enzyme 1 n=1 Tax=Thalictrum thalictroides TaxID=46969 RepID=A0A7J6V7B4_THATH|nr:Ubiquitin-fold modifier-conjugating enzyme [Thalictrum thalictroides]
MGMLCAAQFGLTRFPSTLHLRRHRGGGGGRSNSSFNKIDSEQQSKIEALSSLSKLDKNTGSNGPRDGAAWMQRLKEEYKASIAYTGMNKSNDNDWFRISAANPKETRWTGKCWYVHNLLKYELDLSTTPEIELPELDGNS